MTKKKETVWEELAREAGEILVGVGKKIDQAIADADGDIIEAMSGHKCGPDCWHEMNPIGSFKTEAECAAAARRRRRETKS